MLTEQLEDAIRSVDRQRWHVERERSKLVELESRVEILRDVLSKVQGLTGTKPRDQRVIQGQAIADSEPSPIEVSAAEFAKRFVETRHETFTIDDVAAYAERHGSPEINRNALQAALLRLRKHGLIEQVSEASGRTPAVYVSRRRYRGPGAYITKSSS